MERGFLSYILKRVVPKASTSLETHIGRLRAYSVVNIQCSILTERTKERKAGSEVQVRITDL